jgi:hypothetical protein
MQGAAGSSGTLFLGIRNSELVDYMPIDPFELLCLLTATG